MGPAVVASARAEASAESGYWETHPVSKQFMIGAIALVGVLVAFAVTVWWLGPRVEARKAVAAERAKAKLAAKLAHDNEMFQCHPCGVFVPRWFIGATKPSPIALRTGLPLEPLAICMLCTGASHRYPRPGEDAEDLEKSSARRRRR